MVVCYGKNKKKQIQTYKLNFIKRNTTKYNQFQGSQYMR